MTKETQDVINDIEKKKALREKIATENAAMLKKQSAYMLKQWKPVTAEGTPFQFGESYYYWQHGRVRDIVPVYSTLAISRYIDGTLQYSHYDSPTSDTPTVVVNINHLFQTSTECVRYTALNRIQQMLDGFNATREKIDSAVETQIQEIQSLRGQLLWIQEVVEGLKGGN